MHYEDGTPNMYKYGTRDGRWRYEMEVMITILDLAKRSGEDGRFVESLGLDHSDGDDDIDVAMNEVVNEDSDDDVVEIENPNPIIPKPPIEISSDTKVEPEYIGEVSSIPQQNDDEWMVKR